MKAFCANCRVLRDMNYPTSILDDGGFIISGRCAACEGYLEQKKKFVVASKEEGGLIPFAFPL
jgi:hypothetical protein